MKTALLTNSPTIQQWFEKDYAEVCVYNEVSEEMRRSKAVIIISMYKVNANYFQILNMWKRYMRVRHPRHKLFVLGWEARRFPNYLQINSMPENLAQYLKEGRMIKEDINYPNLVDRNILIPIKNFLYSHGDNTFHKILEQVRNPLGRVERELKNYRIEQLRETEEVKLLYRYTKKLKELWKSAQSFFELMPNYPEIKQYMELEQKLLSVLYKGEKFSPYVYLQIGTYLNEVLTETTSFYQLENNER